MHKSFIILIIFISFTLNSIGQTRINECKDLFTKEIDLNKIEENIETFKIDFQTIMLCEFDTIDYQIMIGPKKDMIDIAAELLGYMDENEKGKVYTFSDLVENIKEFIETEEYIAVREIVETRNELIVKNAILSNWEEDEKSLEKIRYSAEQIEIIKEIIRKNEGKTYEEIFKISYPILIEIENNKSTRKTKETSSSKSFIMACDNVIELWEGAYTFNSYSECLVCSQKINKPILFYFSGYGCIECVEFMANILLNSVIKNIIENKYVYIIFITDARENLNKNEVYFSKLQDKDIITEGERNLDLQLEKFNNSNRPYFVIVSQDGTILREYGNGVDLEKFKDFLNE